MSDVTVTNTANETADFHNESDFHVPCDLVNRTTAEICETIACAFIFITSTFGNSMVVIVVYRERQMRTTVNFLIVNMAVSDFLYTLFVIPRVMTQVHTYPDAWLITGTAGLAFCKIVHFFQDVTVAVSLLSLLMIAVERYYAISCPVVADPIPRKRCAMMIVFTWLMAFLMFATNFFTFRLSIEEEGPICSHGWEQLVSDPLTAREIEFLFHTILSLIIPFIVVTAFYTTILIRIRRTSVPGDATSMARRRQLKRNRNVLRMLLTVLFAFGLCWFPFIAYTYVVTYVWIKTNRHLEIPCGVEIFGQWALYFAYLNSSVNPVIYFVFCENYRNGFTKLIWPFSNKQPSYRTRATCEIDTAQVRGTKRRRRRGVLCDQAQDIDLLVRSR